MPKAPETVLLQPMLAVTCGTLPEADDWRLEPKYDGMRAIVAFEENGDLAAYTRTGRDASGAFPELAAPPRSLRGRRAVLDGELVTFEPGTTVGSFRRMQRRIGIAGSRAVDLAAVIPARFVAFDLLVLDDEMLLQQPLDERRRQLEQLLDARGADSPWLLCPRIDRAPDAAFQLAVAAGHEGLIAKRGQAPYEPGQRANSWCKIRRQPREELVVVGWSAAPDDASRPGSLEVASRRAPGEPLVWAGRVASGIGERERELLHGLFLTRHSDAPTAVGVPERTSIHHLVPELVVEVVHSGWDPHGHLQRPGYLGIRPDRDPRTVVRDPMWR